MRISDWSSDVCSSDLIAFDLHVGDACLPVRSPLLGRFNVANLLAVAGVLSFQGVEPEAIADALSRLEPIPGRMNRLGGDGVLPLVVIDYSHKPDPLEQALASLRSEEHTSELQSLMRISYAVFCLKKKNKQI